MFFCKFATYFKNSFSQEVSDKDPKFKIGDHVRISECNIFAKDDNENWFEKVSVIRKVKNTVP